MSKGTIGNIRWNNLAESIFALGYDQRTEIPSSEEFDKAIKSINQDINEIMLDKDNEENLIEMSEYLSNLSYKLKNDNDTLTLTKITHSAMASFDMEIEGIVARFDMSYALLHTIEMGDYSTDGLLDKFYSLLKENLNKFPLYTLLIRDNSVKDAKNV